MKNLRLTSLLVISVATAFALFLCSCSNNNNTPTQTYKITITNITNNQPLSPAGFVIHTPGYTPWEAGATASSELEMLAEGGDATAFLNEADASSTVLDAATGNRVIGPGGSDSVKFVIKSNADLHISFATMLVNTNDAFTGISSASIADLSVDESVTFVTRAYDAGTEVNSETAATVPGPAAGSEGYNPERNDRGFVTVHVGVVTTADGLATSSLNESHRWQNPVARLMVTRTH